MIETLCPVKAVAGYSGEDGVDYWNKDKWNQELTKYQVRTIFKVKLCLKIY